MNKLKFESKQRTKMNEFCQDFPVTIFPYSYLFEYQTLQEEIMGTLIGEIKYVNRWKTVIKQ